MKKHHKLIGFMACILILQSCDNPTSIALHNPIYPSAADRVEYTLEMQGEAGSSPREVKLYEQITSISVIRLPFPFGVREFIIRTPFPETLLNTWMNPAIGTLSFRKEVATPESSLVKYRFEVTQRDNNVFKHEVSYATQNYPIADDPIPVYVVGDESNTMDVVFIPDSDITNLATFRDHCRRNIGEAYFQEATTKKFRHSFNFYINPRTGHATDYDRIATDGQHQVPSNYARLSFAEGKVIMHESGIRDYASNGLFSSIMQERGIIMHESGHALFGLADEYDGGEHWQAASLPNNWSSLAGAQTDAPNRGKTAADVQQIATSGWYKICIDNCQMSRRELTLYDRPCTDRVINQILNNAQN